MSTTNGNNMTRQTRTAAPTATRPSRRASHPAANNGKPPSAASSPQANIPRLGFRLEMQVASLLYGLGTYGSRIVDWIVRLVTAENGRLPKAANYLTIDGAARPQGSDPLHSIPIDFAGCGTNQQRGQQQFLKPEHYNRIRHNVECHFNGLTSSDPQVTVYNSPAEAVTSWLFLAPGGGSGGGMFQDMITLLHHAGQRHGVKQHRVHAVLVGADMPIRDSSRTVTPEQKLAIPQNTASNLVKVFSDITSSAVSDEPLPDGTSFRLPAAERVWAPYLIDQSNGLYHLPTSDDLVAMAAWEFFLQIFTQVGRFVEERDIDNQCTGVPSRGTQ